MRKYIVEQMNKGASLENIHSMVEKMYKEEQNKREKERKDAANDAALKRAAQATADYFNLVLGEDTYPVELFEGMLKDLADDVVEAAPVIKITKAKAKNADTDMEAIQAFLKSISAK